MQNQPRGATVIAKTFCKLAKINKDVYVKVAKHQDQLNMKKKVEFLSQVNICQKLSNEELNIMGCFGNEVTYSKGSEIIKEGQTNLNSIKIIKSGEVKECRQGIEIALISTYGIIGDLALMVRFTVSILTSTCMLT
jgi:hypothetical protein